jgi:t-SNARE complex subunit (syntaxin)
MSQEIIFEPYVRSDLIELNKQIIQLNDLFKMISTLVEEQREPLDTIEDNINKSKVIIEDIEEELVITDKYYRNNIMLKLCFTGLLSTTLGIPLSMIIGTKTVIGTVIFGSVGYIGFNNINKLL